MKPSLFILMVAVLAFCSCTKQPAVSVEEKIHLKVFVRADGSITADGVGCDLPGLARQMDTLKQKKGVVWYSRANPQGEPPPQAMAVTKLLVEKGLPVAMFLDEAFTQRMTF